MDSDNQPASRPQPRPKVAPLTEWQTPTLPAYKPAPRGLPRRTVTIIGGVVALLLALIAAHALFSTPDVGELVETAPIAKTAIREKRNDNPAARNAPVTLPSGMEIDRSSALNYDLAAWLATTPTAPRTFVFDRLRFATGSATVGDSDGPMLQLLSQVLAAYPQARATITANGPGSLGMERAEAIRSALLALGTDPAQLTATAGDGSETAPKLTVRLEMGVGTDLDA